MLVKQPYFFLFFVDKQVFSLKNLNTLKVKYKTSYTKNPRQLFIDEEVFRSKKEELRIRSFICFSFQVALPGGSSFLVLNWGGSRLTSRGYVLLGTPLWKSEFRK